MHALIVLQADKPGLQVYAYDAASKGGCTVGRVHKISGGCHCFAITKGKERKRYAFRQKKA